VTCAAGECEAGMPYEGTRFCHLDLIEAKAERNGGPYVWLQCPLSAFAQTSWTGKHSG
jgi:hypothetical protein